MKKSIFFSVLSFCTSILAHQTTDTVLMILPDTFEFNHQTGRTNRFQYNIECENIALAAKDDFDRMQDILNQNGVNIITLPSRPDIRTPDAVFPNWFSLHEKDGKTVLVLYPMLNENRQAERQVTALKTALGVKGIHIDDILDLTYFESEGKALESTGSLILDRINKIAYASISPRTHLEVLNTFTKKMGYSSIAFSSLDEEGTLIYHTDIMMSIGSQFAVLCKDCIANPQEAEIIIKSLEATGKRIIYISFNQMHQMCSNILEIRSQEGTTKIVMSDTAYAAFTENQLLELQQFGTIIHTNIDTIKTIGGGSSRCMLAEVFYSKT